MQPVQDVQECQSPDLNLDYPPILMNRNQSFDRIEIKQQNVIVDKFKLKLRHTSTLPAYESNDEEEVKVDKTTKKPKKQLKLVTNAKLDDDMEKSKSFSPQPNTNQGCSYQMHLTYFSFLPIRNLKQHSQLFQNEEFHYSEEFFDVTTRKGNLKYQQDRVMFFWGVLSFIRDGKSFFILNGNLKFISF